MYSHYADKDMWGHGTTVLHRTGDSPLPELCQLHLLSVFSSGNIAIVTVCIANPQESDYQVAELIKVILTRFDYLAIFVLMLTFGAIIGYKGCVFEEV